MFRLRVLGHMRVSVRAWPSIKDGKHELWRGETNTFNTVGDLQCLMRRPQDCWDQTTDIYSSNLLASTNPAQRNIASAKQLGTLGLKLRIGSGDMGIGSVLVTSR